MFHYTDKSGWNAIRSQKTWRFKASKPKAVDRPEGVYFTDIEPSAVNLRLLHKKLRVPREKQEYVFWLDGKDGLTQLNGGTGRDKHIYFSPVDYSVAPDRQRYEGAAQAIVENFP